MAVGQFRGPRANWRRGTAVSGASKIDAAAAAGKAPRAGDWARSLSGYMTAWGIPSAAIVLSGLLAPAPRAAVWTVALVWMGTACLLNARRCGRVHCRYTGPYYLLLIGPAVGLGSGALELEAWAWWLLGAMILLGSKLIWLVTERLWGKYRA